ncbi:MAG: MarR family transcriptional regulator [candidate division KSB1 bacterium]|nr:MarR family transcriptional regulator [candidate division KSB1 bacterium]MDZ7295613.1 MarR family transcriptional regulator [candidate division KSB1 bacterium]MDZ7393831.1 MarR family transcriptional regulator [candidate division KSB1 bacterium]
MQERLFQLIMAVSAKCWSTEEKIMDQLALSPAEFNGLLVLKEGERLPAFEFSAKMGLSPSRGSRVIDRLVKRGYVAVETAAEDRRRVEVRLTESGIHMQRRMAELMTECEDRLLKALTPAQQMQVRTALELLVQVM